jgi:hypothetical protein
MTGKRWLVAGVVAILLAGSGCVSCGNKSFALAREVGPECEQPTCQRNHVYVFAICGMNPAGIVALDKLREELNRQGFAKVGTGQAVHAWWMAREMRRIRAQEPDAVFVLLGSESGAPVAAKLAERAAADGLPVAAVVYLDADGAVAIPPVAFGVRTLAVGGFSPGRPFGVESVEVAAGTFDLPSDTRTVAVVAQVLNEIAQTTTAPLVEHVTAWWYRDAPPARPVVDPGRDPQWAFLFDQPGDVPLAIGQGSPVIVAKPTQPTYTSVAR